MFFFTLVQIYAKSVSKMFVDFMIIEPLKKYSKN